MRNIWGVLTTIRIFCNYKNYDTPSMHIDSVSECINVLDTMQWPSSQYSLKTLSNLQLFSCVLVSLFSFISFAKEISLFIYTPPSNSAQILNNKKNSPHTLFLALNKSRFQIIIIPPHNSCEDMTTQFDFLFPHKFKISASLVFNPPNDIIGKTISQAKTLKDALEKTRLE